MTRKLIYLSLLLFGACTMPEKKLDLDATADTTHIVSEDSNRAIRDSEPLPLPATPAVKTPKGVYHTVLPFNGGTEHTVAFYNDFTYQLQETFRRDQKDSVSVIRGTWSPSDGYIWLYKDQVVRARYTWQGDQLHYFSPQLKKTIGMSPMVDIMSNAVWKEKPKQGITLFGIGNEPFWSVEVNNRDSLFFLLSEWSQPVKLRIEDKKATADSVAYSAKNDSVSIRLSIYPLFCSDGMSDHVYKNKIRVRYNGTIYNGCGMLYKQ